jgi:competence protein ComEC
MFRWIPFTFVRTVTFFIAGILAGIYLPGAIGKDVAISLTVVVMLIYGILFRVIKHESKWALGVPAFLIIILSGYLHLTFQNESSDPNHLLHHKGSVEAYTVKIESYAEEKDKSWKVTGELLKVQSNGWQTISGKVLLYFSKEVYHTPFNYGDILVVRGQPSLVNAPSNPGEFDYKRFLTFRNIYHQHFVRESTVIKIANEPSNWPMAYAIKTREWADEIIKQFVHGKREQSIASALVLGVTDGLDNDLLNAYAATGAMHVLAVSGLHISIIYIIILWLLKPFTKSQSSKIWVAEVSLLILWSYAFITGLSPSVLRAVTMFTFIAIASATGRNTNIYNTLAASCFCLLVFDPYLVMSVGFQLSYIAVLGIVYLQPLMYAWWEPRTWFFNEVWKITCVSIAAQLATFPLGLLYFHQFPNYFLLSNLLVIPISFAVLILGLILLVVNFISWLATLVGWLLTYSIKLLNLVVETVELFPYSLIEGVRITTFQCWLLIGAIVCMIVLFKYRKFNYLIFASILICAYTGMQWITFLQQKDQDKLTVYNVAGHPAVDLITRGKAYFISDSSLYTDAEKIRFHIRPNREAHAVQSIIISGHPFTKVVPGGKVILWKNKMIWLIQDDTFAFNKHIDPQIIIVSKNAVKEWRKLADYRERNITLIFDSSNSRSYVRAVEKFLMQKKIHIHSVPDEGSFELII